MGVKHHEKNAIQFITFSASFFFFFKYRCSPLKSSEGYKLRFSFRSLPAKTSFSKPSETTSETTRHYSALTTFIAVHSLGAHFNTGLAVTRGNNFVKKKKQHLRNSIDFVPGRFERGSTDPRA